MTTADPRDIITLDEAKEFLNFTTEANDYKISPFITAASLAWIRRIGPVSGSPVYDEWYDGGSPTIVLRHPPVQSVSLVTEALSSSTIHTLTAEVLDGSGGGTYCYSIDLSSGLLVRRASGVAIPFAGGLQSVRVTYVAGYATAPEDIKLAVKAIVKQLWDSQRGPGTRPGSAPDMPVPVSLWPAMAKAIADDYYVPGIG